MGRITILSCSFSMLYNPVHMAWCKQEEPSGFLSLNRVMSLDRFVALSNAVYFLYMFLSSIFCRWCYWFVCNWNYGNINSLEIDLSKELATPSKPLLQQAVETTTQVRQWSLFPITTCCSIWIFFVITANLVISFIGTKWLAEQWQHVAQMEIGTNTAWTREVG